ADPRIRHRERRNCMSVVAIDGPSGVGKSSTAKEVARRLGYQYLDTGAMYRAMAWLRLNRRVTDRSEERRVGEEGEEYVDGGRAHTRSKRDWSSDVCSSDRGRSPNPPSRKKELHERRSH